jgi:exosome complex RNA-binding protein Rrp42 (RNase PH superfamily)
MDDNAKFSVEGVAAGVRADGRGLLDYRACVCSEDTLLHANGSATVTLGGLGKGSTTRCLGVVKAEVGRCAGVGEGGAVVGSVTLAMFRGGVRERQEREAFLSESLCRVLSSSPAFLERLVIPGSRGEFCWVLHVDVTVLELGGSVLDAASFAAHAALRSCVLPRVRAVEAEAGKLQLELVQDGEMVAEEEEEEEEEVLEGGEEGELAGARYEFLDTLSATARRMMPISITLTVIRGRSASSGDVDEYVLVDTSEAEEQCNGVTSRITVSVDMDGHVCALDVRGSGSSAAVSPPTLKRCVRAAARVGRCIFQKLGSGAK